MNQHILDTVAIILGCTIIPMIIASLCFIYRDNIPFFNHDTRLFEKIMKELKINNNYIEVEPDMAIEMLNSGMRFETSKYLYSFYIYHDEDKVYVTFPTKKKYNEFLKLYENYKINSNISINTYEYAIELIQKRIKKLRSTADKELTTAQNNITKINERLNNK